jgi:outer membrane protein assembly factor BamA
MSPMKTLMLALALALVLAALVRAQEPPEPFLSVSASDFTEICLDDESCLGPAGKIYYNRVDGLTVYLGARYRSEVHLHPRVDAVWGWPSARDDGYYQMEFEQPVHSQDSFSFGVAYYGRTAWSRQDDEAITNLDNSLRAMFAKEDLRDYFRREGATVFVQHWATPELVFRVEFRNDRLESISEQQSVWSLFGNDSDWRENPPLEVGILKATREFEGRMRSWYGHFVYDSRDFLEHSGWHGRGFFEFSGGSTGGDYTFRKYEFDLSHYVRLTETQTLTLTGRWGIASGTDFPSHKLFYLGGMENLRGFERSEFAGKNLLFGRAEYNVQIRPRFETIYFLDAGEVWLGTTGFDTDGMKYDVGIGFRYDVPGLGDVRLDVARALAEDADIVIDFRLLVY